MSWKVHGTDEVFAALRGLCSNSYRMYDPCEHRYYYDHECDVYECAVEDAAQEYERLLEHCEKQREELAAIKNPLGKLKESFGGDMDNIDGGTEIERIEGSSRFEQGSSITDELRRIAAKTECANGRCEKLYRGDLDHIADRIDERMEREYVKLPVDADGVPIRVGDVMEGEKIGGGFSEPFEVVGYIMSNGELEPMDEHKCPRKHVYLHHHHELTVEDVLREFFSRYVTTKPKDEDDAIIAEYAAKLRLAGDAE